MRQNLEGIDQPPKVTVNGKEVTVCFKGSSKGKVCIKDNCGFAHLFSLDKCTKGVSELNTWIVNTNSVKFSSQKIAAAAAKAKAKAKQNQWFLKKIPIKKTNNT